MSNAADRSKSDSVMSVKAEDKRRVYASREARSFVGWFVGYCGQRSSILWTPALISYIDPIYIFIYQIR